MSISNYGSLKIVNTTSSGKQWQQSVAGLSDGRILVVWEDDTPSFPRIRAQLYTSLGDPIGNEFTPDTNNAGFIGVLAPHVVASGNGGYALAFSASASPAGFALEFHNPDGSLVGGGTSISGSSSLDVKFVSVIEGGGELVYANAAKGSGDVQINDFASTTASTASAGLQTWPDIAAIPTTNRFVVSWWDDQAKTVKARVFDQPTKVVNPITAEISVGLVGSEPGTNIFNYRADAVAGLAGGNFVVTWHSSNVSSADTNGRGIQAAVYTKDGVLVKSAFQVNTTTAGDQSYPDVVALADGGFAVAWSDNSGGTPHITLRTFDASGNATSSEFDVDGTGHSDWAVQLSLLADGRLAVVWEADQSVPQDTSSYHVEMQIVDPRSGPVTLTAISAGSDFVGTSFNDTFISGTGNDRFTGGGGTDTAKFSHAKSAYTIAHSNGNLVVSGPDGTDTLSGIEKLAFSDATLVVVQRPDDFDGNGTSDAFLHKADGSLYVNTYSGTTVSGGGPAGGWSADFNVVATGDFNGDGRTDFAVRHHATGELYFIFYHGTFVDSTGFAGAPTLDWDVAGTGDFNDDGFSDIMLRNHSTGQLWINLYNGTSIISSGPAGGPTTDWDVAGIGDFNRDGFSDVLLRNHNTGQLYINLYNGLTMVGSGSAGNPTTDWDVGGIGDFNNDGYSDVLLHNHVTGQLWINLYNGVNIVSSGTAGHPTTDWDVARVADYNNDGFADVMLRNHIDGSLYMNLYQGLTPVGSGPAGSPSLDWQFISV
jgi:hypothetical protein